MKTSLMLCVALCTLSTGAFAAETPQAKKKDMSAKAKVGQEAAVKLTAYTQYKEYFSVSLPEGWGMTPTGASGEAQKVYGVQSFGLRTPDGVLTRISVDYYGPGNSMYGTFQSFVDTFSKPDPLLKIKDDKFSAVSNGKLSGRQTKEFEHQTVEFQPPDAASPKRVPVKEAFVVVKGEQGFYTLRYYSTTELFAKNLPLFEAVKKSFKPVQK